MIMLADVLGQILNSSFNSLSAFIVYIFILIFVNLFNAFSSILCNYYFLDKITVFCTFTVHSDTVLM